MTTVNAYKLEVIRTRIAEPAPLVNSSAEVARRYAHLQKYDREHLIRLDLDNQNRIIGEETISIGTANAALVLPGQVFRGALLSGAVHCIILHNHPSGDPQPSEEDRQVHEKLIQAGEIPGIQHGNVEARAVLASRHRVASLLHSAARGLGARRRRKPATQSRQ